MSWHSSEEIFSSSFELKNGKYLYMLNAAQPYLVRGYRHLVEVPRPLAETPFGGFARSRDKYKFKFEELWVGLN